MFRALSSAATGMNAQELRVSMISNNLANVSSAGYKKSRAEFQDLLYQKRKAPAGNAQPDTLLPTKPSEIFPELMSIQAPDRETKRLPVTIPSLVSSAAMPRPVVLLPLPRKVLLLTVILWSIGLPNCPTRIAIPLSV